MKILHLPTSTGGNSWGLSQAERSLGQESRVLIADPNPYQYHADIKIPTSFRKKPGILSKDDIQSGYHLVKTFLKIRKDYDIFHFNFGKTLLDFPKFHLNLIDLPYYPKKSKLFVTYNGCDARQKRETINRTSMSACHHDTCYGGMCQDIRIDQIKKKNIQKFSQYASHIFTVNPDLMYFLPPEKSSFIPYTIHNWSDISETCENPSETDRITIVHAPTQPVAKGTPYILKAIQNLQERHPDSFEFILVQNVPYQEALQIYQKADLIIDQLLIGWYGAFAVEAMLMQKPVAAFIREEDLQFIPAKMAEEVQKALINISINTIEDKLESVIENPGILKEYAKNGYNYVKNWHDPKKIANEVIRYYES